MAMKPERILAEIEDLLRTMPPAAQWNPGNQSVLGWIGRGGAVMEHMDGLYNVSWEVQAQTCMGTINQRHTAYQEMIRLLHKARHALMLKVEAPSSIAVKAGQVFDYYDGLRGIIEQATTDILFVDPYLDAEFVSRYLPSVKSGVTIRLLARERLATLVPAVRAFEQQEGIQVEVRSGSAFHDRFVFVDKTACYQSSGSFKDGGKKSPVVIMPLADAAAPLLAIYEGIWSAGTPQA